MARKLASDRILFAAFVALALLGCVMIYSASALEAARTWGNPYRYLFKQLSALALGLGLAFAVSRTDAAFLRRPWVVYGGLGVCLVLCVAVLFRPPINAARRWLVLGKFTLQPAEFLKVALVLFLAYQIDRKRDRLDDFLRGILPTAFFLAIATALVLAEPDLGTAASYVIVAATLLFLAGAPLRYFAVGAAAFFPVLAILAVSASYRRQRIFSFLHPDADPLGKGFQAAQSLIAVGTGGWLGNGLGQSRQKLFFLPYPHTDFIYAIVGEELGFVGAILVLGLFGGGGVARGLAGRRGAAPEPLSRVPGGRRDGDDRASGGDQRRRRPHASSHEGHSAPVPFIRRFVACRGLHRRGPPLERLAARHVRWREAAARTFWRAGAPGGTSFPPSRSPGKFGGAGPVSRSCSSARGGGWRPSSLLAKGFRSNSCPPRGSWEPAGSRKFLRSALSWSAFSRLARSSGAIARAGSSAVGGYASLPVVLAARLLEDSHDDPGTELGAGAQNRIAGRFRSASAAVGFESAARSLPDESPFGRATRCRPEFFEISPRRGLRPPGVSLRGSQGSRVLTAASARIGAGPGPGLRSDRRADGRAGVRGGFIAISPHCRAFTVAPFFLETLERDRSRRSRRVPVRERSRSRSCARRGAPLILVPFAAASAAQVIRKPTLARWRWPGPPSA